MADNIIKKIKASNGTSVVEHELGAKYDSDGNVISTTYAKLSSGKIPSSMLPSYVDDVIEGYYLSSKFYKTNSTSGTVITGEAGKIYVDLTTNKTYRYSGSAYVEIASQIAYETNSAAPNTHTHTVTVKGTTGNNSGNAVPAVTGYGSFSGGSGSLEGNTTNTGIQYLENVSHTAASLTGTKTFNTDAIKSVALSASTTSTDGPAYVESVEHSPATLGGVKTFVTGVTEGSGSLSSNTTSTDGIKYVEKQGAFSAGTTPPASATFTGTAATSGVNSGTAVTALTGVKVSSSSSAAPGGHTHNYDKTTGISLTANDATATGRITYVQSISGTAPSLTGTQTFVTKISGGSGSLTAYDAATGGTQKVADGTRIPFVTSVTHTPANLTGTKTFVTAQGTFSAGTTPPKSASPNHTTLDSGSNGGGTSVTIASVDASGVLTLASSVNSATEHTHSYEKTTSVSLTAGTAPSLSAASTGTVGISGGSITPVTHYLAHAHTAASIPSDGTGTVGIQNGSYSAVTRYLSATPSNEATTSAANSGTNFNAATAVTSDGTASVAPSGHTHSVTATGNITLNAGTAPSMGSATTKYLHHTHNSAVSAGTGTVTISGGSITPVTKYMKATGTAASTGTVGISGGSVTKTTKYLHHTHNAASLGSPSTSNAAPHTHTHSYGSSTALTTGNNSGSGITVMTPIG